MIENLIEIEKDQLLGVAQQMVYEDYRFVTATCVDNADGSLDVFYHFDKDFQLRNYKLTVKKGEEVPSISAIFFCAVLVENEMKELFGLKVTNIAIDYEGHLLLSDGAPDNPMERQQIVIVKKGE